MREVIWPLSTRIIDLSDQLPLLVITYPATTSIATFTTDLVESLTLEQPEVNCWVVAMNDKPEGYLYPKKVRFAINQDRIADYAVAAEFPNISQADLVCVQHEYGIFGGSAGSHLLKLLAELRVPVVTTLHTVLKHPGKDYYDVLLKLAALSDKLIVMSHKAVAFLKEIYGVPADKIAYIPHGIPDMPFIGPNFYKDKFGVEGKKVLLTFGLLSPNKGLETMLRALPAVIEKHAVCNDQLKPDTLLDSFPIKIPFILQRGLIP